MSPESGDRPSAASDESSLARTDSHESSPARVGYHHGDLRSALIEEVEKMVAANQLDLVTMNELSARLGVARSAPYRHFKSKGALLCAVATRAKERVHVMVRSHLQDNSRTFSDRFKGFSRAFYAFSIANPDFYKLLYRENLVEENQTSELAVAREGVFVGLVDFLLEGQELGEIRQSDVETQVMFWWTTFHGMVSFVLDRHFPEEYFSGMLDSIIDALLRGLGAMSE